MITEWKRFVVTVKTNEPVTEYQIKNALELELPVEDFDLEWVFDSEEEIVQYITYNYPNYELDKDEAPGGVTWSSNSGLGTMRFRHQEESLRLEVEFSGISKRQPWHKVYGWTESEIT